MYAEINAAVQSAKGKEGHSPKYPKYSLIGECPNKTLPRSERNRGTDW